MTSVMSIIIASPISSSECPEIQHGIQKTVKKHLTSLKEKNPLREGFLGAVACDPEHDSWVILIFLAFLSL